MASITTFGRASNRSRRRDDVTVGAAARCAIRCGCWRVSGRSASSPATTVAARSSPAGAASPRRRRGRRRADPAEHRARRAPIRPQAAPLESIIERAAPCRRSPAGRRDPPGGRHRPALPAPAGAAGHVAGLPRRLPRHVPRDADRRAARRARPGDRRLRPPARRRAPGRPTAAGRARRSATACRRRPRRSPATIWPRCARRRAWTAWVDALRRGRPRHAGWQPTASSTPRRWPPARRTASARPRSPRPATTATRSTGTSST